MELRDDDVLVVNLGLALLVAPEERVLEPVAVVAGRVVLAEVGASALGPLRSVEMPWAYELSYAALLFHTGIIGFLIYSSGVICIFWMGLKIMRSGHWLGIYMLPVLVGTTCFLIANATNPYLEKFDYIWVIFLPVALINIWLLNKGKSCHFQKNHALVRHHHCQLERRSATARLS